MPPTFFFFFVGLLICGFAAWLWWRTWAVQSWIPVTATLEIATTEMHRVHIKGMPGKYAVPKVRCSYAVGGVMYHSDRFSVTNFSLGLPEEMKEIVQGKSAGGTLKAYYDPRNPHRAILQRPGTSTPLGFLAVGGTICALAVVIQFN